MFWESSPKICWSWLQRPSRRVTHSEWNFNNNDRQLGATTRCKMTLIIAPLSIMTISNTIHNDTWMHDIKHTSSLSITYWLLQCRVSLCWVSCGVTLRWVSLCFILIYWVSFQNNVMFSIIMLGVVMLSVWCVSLCRVSISECHYFKYHNA